MSKPRLLALVAVACAFAWLTATTIGDLGVVRSLVGILLVGGVFTGAGIVVVEFLERQR